MAPDAGGDKRRLRLTVLQFMNSIILAKLIGPINRWGRTRNLYSWKENISVETFTGENNPAGTASATTETFPPENFPFETVARSVTTKTVTTKTVTTKTVTTKSILLPEQPTSRRCHKNRYYKK
jgi:hypothetical protein